MISPVGVIVAWMLLSVLPVEELWFVAVKKDAMLSWNSEVAMKFPSET